jgi:hypothetical protein
MEATEHLIVAKKKGDAAAVAEAQKALDGIAREKAAKGG